MKLGSLFSGAGGLDRAVTEVFGGKVAWHSEVDAAASKVLAHRFPDVPNLGDVTAIDWDTVTPVDVMCGGYPCQPFSAAGQRKGTEDERHLWPHFAEAIRRVRPRFVVLENVAGHRSMGFGSVLGDLAEAGYDAQWCSVRASDVGAPHRRERIFVLATDTSGHGWDAWRPESVGFVGGSDAALSGDGPVELLPTPSAADGGGGHLTRSGNRGGELLLPGVARAYGNGELLPTPNASDGSGGGQHPERREGHSRQLIDYILVDSTHWGRYAPAIARWEQIVGPAPSPTEPNRNGKPRLNPAFSEWMMGWPAGWVTAVPGISRNDALRIIGNGVVPQQAVAALRWLLNVAALEVAS